ncbi:TRAP transporter 4TM/12TM fusion protein [Lipingzhangella halophila]|uniref:TRAP transporter 4TM/12TM fusion protein n=1 Tax=Lipingzhangella halophila TaxID=1783352 RepID=A0A7W7RCZ0_9ACTN|nr:TRAP transporter permease [Lipingzhangella halophila]MBB4929689.1 TRAP transporter 4TM/12TM fusion protein [Lipingzhangella halophila]
MMSENRESPTPQPDAPVLPESTDRDGPPMWRELATARWGGGRAGSVLGLVVLGIAVAFSGYQAYTALSLSLDSYLHRVIHLMFVLVLVFLVRPAAKGAWARRPPMAVVDLLLMCTALVVSLYPVVFFGDIVTRIGAPTTLDLTMGAIAIVLLLEACRRTIGLFMSVLVAAFMVYAWVGPLLPDTFAHRGYTFQRIVYHTYLFQEGIYGLPLGVAATFVFVFILFGALLQKTGGGNFFVGLAYCFTGRYTGGPAKGAVVGSAFMGSVSGSAIANTVTSGAFTIPLMKRVGYKPHEAGGVEAAASTGGQVLPPIMGAGAFIMAERLGVPYVDIVKVAIIPALMYFAVVFVFVDILARKRGIGGLPPEQLPRLRTTLAAGYHFLAPFILLITLLLMYVTPLRAGLYAIALLFIVAMLRAASRLDWRDIGEVFVLAARNTLGVSVATAVAGIIVGMVGLTGLGLALSSVMLSVAGGSLLATLAMIALASLVLGLGLPVTAAYIVLIVLAGPALEDLGVALIVAHMIVYWFSQDSNVTPPVALAAFSASGIAGSDPMRTGVSAWKFAKGLYLIPLLMAYSPLLLNGTPAEVAWAAASGMVALVAAAVALEGFMRRRTLLVERIGFTIAAVLVFHPDFWTDAAGVALAAVLFAVQFLGEKTAIEAPFEPDSTAVRSPA